MQTASYYKMGLDGHLSSYASKGRQGRSTLTPGEELGTKGMRSTEHSQTYALSSVVWSRFPFPDYDYDYQFCRMPGVPEEH